MISTASVSSCCFLREGTGSGPTVFSLKGSCGVGCSEGCRVGVTVTVRCKVVMHGDGEAGLGAGEGMRSEALLP